MACRFLINLASWLMRSTSLLIAKQNIRKKVKMLKSDIILDARAFANASRLVDQQLQRKALRITDRAARTAKDSMRQAMAGAGLGTLGMGLGHDSDLSTGNGVHQRGDGSWSAQGRIYVRSKSARTRGAIESYTSGASIRPKKGRYLWIATDAVKRLVGLGGRTRKRLEPVLWDRTYGRKLGKLYARRGDDGTPLLVIYNVGVTPGVPGSVNSLKRNGQARKGQVQQEMVVAFIGIPNTDRAARISPSDLSRRALQSSLAAES
jgi:hypothetical protein